MFNALSEMLSYPFMQKEMMVGILVSLCAALLGVNLVLKRYSMIGDGLSHVSFGALAIAIALNVAPLVISIPVVVVAAFLLLRVSENSKIKGDAAIALISTGALAVGVIVISVTPGMNIDISSYMFGSLLAVKNSDVWLSIPLSLVVLILYVLFYSRIFSVTFDENFAKATGSKTGIYNMLLALLTAVTIVLGMRLMGALLISSLIISPSLTSMRVFKSFKTVVFSSAVLSVVCFVIGTLISYFYHSPNGGLPLGASVVMVNIIGFLGFSAVGYLKGKR